MDFDTAVARTLPFEGGYVNDPDDPGGETNFGITWPVLYQAIGMGLLRVGATIRTLTREQAIEIYRVLFWERYHMERYDETLSFQVFDAAVNHGPGNAIRFLQRAAGVADDGYWGPITAAAVSAMPAWKLVALFLVERGEFFRKLSKFPKYGSGWMARLFAAMRSAISDWEDGGK